MTVQLEAACHCLIGRFQAAGLRGKKVNQEVKKKLTSQIRTFEMF